MTTPTTPITPHDANSKKLNVLLVGGGGREHALAEAIAASPRLGTLYATHCENPGIGALAVQATSEGDIPVVMGVVVFAALVVVLVNLGVDILQIRGV